MRANKLKSSRSLDATIGLMVLGKVYHHKMFLDQDTTYCLGCGVSNHNVATRSFCIGEVAHYSSDELVAFSLYQHLIKHIPDVPLNLKYDKEFNFWSISMTFVWDEPITAATFPLVVCGAALKFFDINYKTDLINLESA